MIPHSFQSSFFSKTGRFPWVSEGFLERKTPGKIGGGTPRMIVGRVNPGLETLSEPTAPGVNHPTSKPCCASSSACKARRGASAHHESSSGHRTSFLLCWVQLSHKQNPGRRLVRDSFNQKQVVDRPCTYFLTWFWVERFDTS